MLLLGKPVAEQLRAEQVKRIDAAGITPRLAIIQVGSDLASATYIKMKQRYGETIGATAEHHTCKDSLADILELIDKLNADTSVQGIIVQLPLPTPEHTRTVVERIAAAKDIDGLSSHGRFRSATAMAVIKLMEHYALPIKDAKIAMVGSGRLVGQPLIQLLRERGADLTVCDINTKDLKAETLAADTVISATGVGGLIKPDMLRDGTIIIDVGTSEDAGAIVGDVDPGVLGNETLKITPSKGGVGPITVATLFEQLLEAAEI